MRLGINMALPHWVHPVFITLSIVLAISCVVSITFNGLTMIVIGKNHSLHKPAFILLFELALIDFITGLLVQPFYIWKLVILSRTSENSMRVWVKTVDEFSGHVRKASITITALLLTAVGFDRFLALHLKTNYQVIVTIKRAIAVSVLLWIGGIGTVAIAVVTKIKKFMMMVLGFCIFLTLAMFIANRRALVKHQQRVSNNNRNNQVLHPKIQQETTVRVNTQYKSVLTSLKYSFAVFIISYLPVLLVGLLKPFLLKISPDIIPVAVSVVVTNSLTKSAVNPFIYYWKIPTVREEIKKILKVNNAN